ncbi:MAG TPA: hypothetical protein VF762_09080 [Blastocatellia bacterium]|jgi:hypothetical protein
MNASTPVEFSHRELSLLLFVLEDGETASASDSPPSCEESCPIVEDLEELFGARALSREKQLARHLGNHLREALVECGVFELMGAGAAGARRVLSEEEQAKLHEINGRLKQWRCEIKLIEPDRKLLGEAISQLPRSAWISMPRTLWRLRRKLKA